jgi:hypothetical protein
VIANNRHHSIILSATRSLSLQISARRHVCVPQDIRFGFQIFQPVLDDISDADDADQISVSGHGQMPDAMVRHQSHGALQGIVRGNRDRGMGYDLQNRHMESALSMPRYGMDDLAV